MKVTFLSFLRKKIFNVKLKTIERQTDRTDCRNCH